MPLTATCLASVRRQSLFCLRGRVRSITGMGGELYERYSVFHAAVDHCDALVAGRLPHTFADILCGRTAPGLVNETAWTQPVLFTFEYALTALWRAWGIRPSVVLGHSLGEYVAACVAGVLSLEDALRAYRGARPADVEPPSRWRDAGRARR